MNNKILLLAGIGAAAFLYMTRTGTSASNPASFPSSTWEKISDIPTGTYIKDSLGYVGYKDMDDKGIPFIGVIR